MADLLLIKALSPYAACGLPPKWALLVPVSGNVKVFEGSVVYSAEQNDFYPYTPFPRKDLQWPDKPAAASWWDAERNGKERA